MRGRTVRVVTAVALVVVAAGIAFLASRPVAQNASLVDSPLLGTTAPDLSAPTLGGHGTVRLDALRGRVVVLSFFSSWCGPCNEEAPAFALFAWHAHRTRAHVAVLGVVYNDADAAAAAFASKYGLTFPVLEDPGGTIANDFGVTGPPVTVVLDPAGRVSAVLDGPVTAAQLARVATRAVRA